MSASFTETGQQQIFPVRERSMTGLGNSERIRLKFGNYGIEVMESGKRVRVSNLYSMDGGIKTNRTFAVVLFPEIIETALNKEHEAIIGGQSIGIVYKNCGWTVRKQHRYFGEVEFRADHSGVDAVFGDIGQVHPVIHMYSLFVQKQEAEFHYASIAEVHHPDYLKLEDLNEIYGNGFESTRVLDPDIADFLNIVKTKIFRA